MAEEVVGRAVEPVGARLGDHVHHRSARLPELGGEEIRLHLEFLNGIDRGRVLQIGDAGVLLHGHHGDAVEQDVGGRIARAVRDEVRVRVTGAPARPDDPWREVGEGHRISLEVRQRHDRLVVDDLAEVRDRRVHAHGGGADFDALGHLTHIQSGIDGRLLLDGERELAARKLLEARGLDSQHVLTWLQRGNDESALLIDHRCLSRSPVGIGDGDRRVRNRGARRILGCTTDSSRERLCEGQVGR